MAFTSWHSWHSSAPCGFLAAAMAIIVSVKRGSLFCEVRMRAHSTNVCARIRRGTVHPTRTSDTDDYTRHEYTRRLHQTRVHPTSTSVHQILVKQYFGDTRTRSRDTASSTPRGTSRNTSQPPKPEKNTSSIRRLLRITAERNQCRRCRRSKQQSQRLRPGDSGSWPRSHAIQEATRRAWFTNRGSILWSPVGVLLLPPTAWAGVIVAAAVSVRCGLHRGQFLSRDGTGAAQQL